MTSLTSWPFPAHSRTWPRKASAEILVVQPVQQQSEQPAGLSEIDAAHARFTMMFLYLTYSASASTPISAPVPLRFHPPNGAHG